MNTTEQAATQAPMATEQPKSKGWSELEEKVIAMYHEMGGLTRSSAIQKMQRAVKSGRSLNQQLDEGPSTVKVKSATAAEAKKLNRKPKADKPAKAARKSVAEPAFTPRKAQDGTYKPGDAMQETIDNAVRSVVRAKFGKIIPVIGTLGVRYHAPYKQGQPYIRMILDNGHTVFVSLASGVITVSDKPASKTAYTVAMFIARQSRKTKRAAAKLKGEAK